MFRNWLIGVIREAAMPLVHDLRAVDQHEYRMMRALEPQETPIRPVDVPRSFKSTQTTVFPLSHYPDFDEAQQANLKQLEEDKHGA